MSSLAPTTFRAFSKAIKFTRGKGQYLWDDQNNKYLDLFGHNMTVSVGHSHPQVVEAAIQQALKLPHCSSVFQHDAPHELAQRLVETFPSHPTGEKWKVHLVNSGSEAVDLAIQMANAYTRTEKVTSLQNSYHGLQGLARAVTHVTRDVNLEEFADPSNPEELEYSPTYIFEPVQGYGGVNRIDENVVETIRQRSQVLICDEIQTGVGRTGLGMWGFERYSSNLMPDIVVCAKGLGNGIGLVAAVVARNSISENFLRKPFFNTYSCNPLACVAANEVLKVIEENNYISRNLELGERFRRGLGMLAGTDLRGDGLMMGLEILDVMGGEKTATFLQESLKEKFSIIAGRGGEKGNVIRIQPPYCVSEESVDHTIDSIHRILNWSEM